jgi:hypothetical protein
MQITGQIFGRKGGSKDTFAPTARSLRRVCTSKSELITPLSPYPKAVFLLKSDTKNRLMGFCVSWKIVGPYT